MTTGIMQNRPDHLGHRRRLREKFLKSGSGALHDYELVELLLAHAVPRRDVKPAAKALLSRFGSLQGLLDADPLQVSKVPGVGRASAVLVKLVKELHCRSLARQMKGQDALSSPKAVLDFARAALAGHGSECFMAVFLNAKNRVLDHRVIHEGTIDHAIVYPRRIIEQALAARAAGLILVHNHPSGDPTPSDEDLRLTRSIQEAARPLDIRVLDHIIVGREGYCSFAEKKIL
jgi:DNA repair protein RadC